MKKFRKIENRKKNFQNFENFRKIEKIFSKNPKKWKVQKWKEFV